MKFLKPAGVFFTLVAALAASQIQCGREAGPEQSEVETTSADSGHVNLSEGMMLQAGVETDFIKVRLVTDTIRTTGVVGPDQDSITHVRPLTRGRVEKVFVGLGDQVRKGDPLVEYDNIELGEIAGEYLSQWAELQREISLENVALKNFARAQELFKIQAISQREMEVREAELRSAQSAIQSRRANLARVEDKLHRFGLDEKEIEGLRQGPQSHLRGQFSHTTLRAPLEGIVVKRDVVAGEAVDFEKELFTIVDTSHVWVQANLAEKDLSKIRLGNLVRVRTSAYPGEVFEGRIAYVSDTLDPETRVVKVRCLVPNPKRKLKLEMFVDVEIVAPGQRKALVVPHSALMGDRDTYYVFVEQRPGHFSKRIVKIAEQHTEETEVLQGLRPGERIAVKGGFYLKSESQRALIGEK